MNIQAPTLLKAWYEANTDTMQRQGIKVELRLPLESDGLNKAALALEAEPLLGSLTIWGTGMLEYIVMQGETGDDIFSSDVECKSESEISETMNGFLENFQDLIVQNR